MKWLLALVVVALLLGGTATAALKITGHDVVNSSLTGKDVRNSSLTGADIRDRSLTARDFRDSIRGPQGPVGPPGPQGPSGLSIVTERDAAPATIAGGADQLITAFCNANETAVSGGYVQTGTLRAIVVLESAAGSPDPHRDGWSLHVLNIDSNPADVMAIAYCAPLPPGITFSSTPAAPDRQRTAARLRASARTRIDAGGVRGLGVAGR